ncbi:urate hydroxylase PuuD [Zavarzinia compransoris]|uniref:urate hydroxylase PuuD n=1 Tax=Zavarzinia marina TaxID=2911065 RepID=UPI001F34D0CC|nr:urate hydroxylase PuuD [Zavarzinia marina]MCF4164052.1 urate hydroxylase PuuD [Zavarzinia marina]
MDPIVWEWIGAGIRWLHVIAGIAWIGSSFYFVHLDSSLKPRAGLPEGAAGEAWQVHGGGFYHMVKFLVAPSNMPDELTWFKWEAYATWLSGFALLIFVYYFGAQLYLIDAQVMALQTWEAIAISVGSLVLGYGIYDGLCRSQLSKSDGWLAIFGFGFVVLATWIFTLIFSPRGAFMMAGALMGTVMAANVFMVIIPNQRRVVASLMKGEKPDPSLGRTGKQRSMHNNYITLPVVFVMIANHYPLAYGAVLNWLILAVLIVMGVSIRHFFNTMHKGLPAPWWTWWIAGVCALIVVAISRVTPIDPAEDAALMPAAAVAEAPVGLADAADIVISRCSMCHTAEPVWEGVHVAPKGVVLDTPEAVRKHADQIFVASVWTHAMPPSNITEMTIDERRRLARWFQDGAAAVN